MLTPVKSSLLFLSALSVIYSMFSTSWVWVFVSFVLIVAVFVADYLDF